jgi:hypothetical protein
MKEIIDQDAEYPGFSSKYHSFYLKVFIGNLPSTLSLETGLHGEREVDKESPKHLGHLRRG